MLEMIFFEAQNNDYHLQCLANTKCSMCMFQGKADGYKKQRSAEQIASEKALLNKRVQEIANQLSRLKQVQAKAEAKKGGQEVAKDKPSLRVQIGGKSRKVATVVETPEKIMFNFGPEVENDVVLVTPKRRRSLVDLSPSTKPNLPPLVIAEIDRETSEIAQKIAGQMRQEAEAKKAYLKKIEEEKSVSKHDERTDKDDARTETDQHKLLKDPERTENKPEKKIHTKDEKTNNKTMESTTVNNQNNKENLLNNKSASLTIGSSSTADKYRSRVSDCSIVIPSGQQLDQLRRTLVSACIPWFYGSVVISSNSW